MTESQPNHLPLPQLIAVLFEHTLSRLMKFLETNGYDDIRTAHVLSVFLHLRGEGMRSSEIANRAGMTAQSMGEHIDYLEACGYVKRVQDPADGRAKLVVYAARGLEAARDLDGFYADLEAQWTKLLGPDLGADVKESLQKLAQATTEP